MRLPMFLLFSAVCLAICGGAGGEPDDPILAKLDKARQAYDASEEAFRKAVIERLTAAEERAVKAGKKALVDQAVADREAFEANGTLPKSLKVGDLEARRTQARLELQAAFTTALSELTKNRRRAEADAVEREAAAFKARFAGSLLKAGTVWRGEKRYIKGGPGGSHPFELRVTERSGDTFKGIILEDAMSHDVVGTISGPNVEWKNTRVRTGRYPGQPQSGTFEGEVMKLHFSRPEGPGGFPVEAQGTIKLVKKK